MNTEFWLRAFEILLPALVAAIVGGMTVSLSARQLRRNTEIAEKQIAASLEVAKLAYRAQVTAATRHQWITDFRNSLAEVTAQFRTLAMAVSNPNIAIELKLQDLVLPAHRVLLLLDPQDPAFVRIESELKMVNIQDKQQVERIIATILKAGNESLRAEWEKIRSGN